MPDDLAAAIQRHRDGDLAGAATAYRALLAEREDGTAMCNLGAIVRAEGRLEEAEALLRRAVKLQAGRTPARLNLANLLWRTRRLEEAAGLYEEILRIDPAHAEATVNLACTRLAQGDDAAGWALYDQRPERLASRGRRLSFPEWRGEPLAGKRLFILAEQGFGDLILAARFLGRLGAAKVTFACWPPLCRLFAHLPIELVPWKDGIAVPPHDYWALPLSLPRWAAAQPVPYLSGARLSGAGGHAGGVGIAWQGNARPDPGRSLPAALGAELLAMPGAVSLDPADSGAGDFQDTADIVAGCERVISIDTSAAHLAGAMGKPVWLLLQYESADWRWRRTRPWYPNIEIIRQPRPGDWASVVEQVRRRSGLSDRGAPARP